VDAPTPEELAAQLRARPRAARLVDAFAGVPGSHLVGGAVRDLLLERDEPPDLDVVVEGDASAAARAAAERLGGTVTAEHERFDTATVEAPGVRLDVTRMRTESYPAPGALPEVRPGTLEQDLARRDFTVNAIAIALSEDGLGSLHAHGSALEDLDEAVLRIHHPRSFLDDPTRLLRLVRYGARLGFEPEERTDALARDAIAAGAPGTVSAGRIGDELRRIAAEATAIPALARAHAIGLDRALHPDFEPRLDLAQAALDALPDDGRRDLLVLAAGCTRFAPHELRRWLDALELTAHKRDAVVAAALDAETLAERLAHARRPAQIAAAARGQPLEVLAVAGALGAREPVGRWLDELRQVRLEITGDDLLAAGVPEGPAVGQGLEAALAAKLDGQASGRDDELAVALRAAG
jgi:tRNA nucleotidyltransferase (CCA-adding enzyme)